MDSNLVLRGRYALEHSESLLPTLPTEHLVWCNNQLMAQVTEHLLINTVMSVLDAEPNISLVQKSRLDYST